MNSKRSVETVSNVINDFLKRYNLFVETPVWTLGKSPLGGIGVFAIRHIDVGEEIFKDFPIILGPRTTQKDVVFCVVCYKKDDLVPCSKNCGLPICSVKCEEIHEFQCKLIRNRRKSNITTIDEELLKLSAPLQALSFNYEDKKVVTNLKCHKGAIHGVEVDQLKKIGFDFEKHEEEYLRLVCCVMDANAFETIVGNEGNTLNLRGLYPLAGLVNHSCVPNLMHVFDKNHLMVVRASVPIKKGEELFHSYARLIWSTSTRRFHLFKTKHFLCRCPRCSDPTEFGAYVSAFLCKICNGNVISKNPLSLTSNWFCENCKNVVDKKEIANMMSIIGSILNSIESDNLEVIFNFLNRLSKMVTPFNETIIEVKYKTVWIIGYHPKYKLRDIDDDLLEFKTKTCLELIKLIELLKLGECKLKGLILFELYLCLKEKLERKKELLIEVNSKEEKNGELKDILKQAAFIFKDDVSAPEVIKKILNKEY